MQMRGDMEQGRRVGIASRVLVSGLLFIGGWSLWLFEEGPVLRLLCGVALLVFSGCLVGFVVGRGRRAVILSGLVCIGLALSPVEVSSMTRSGLPGIVPLVMGLPGPTLLERADRGEVILGGCIVTGFEPRWVVVW